MSNALTATAEPLDLAARCRAILDGRVAPPPIAGLIGFRVLSCEPGRAVFELNTDLERHANPMGTVHGGILCDLADAAMGFAYLQVLAVWSGLGIAASTSAVATERAAVAALGLWSIHAEMAAPS